MLGWGPGAGPHGPSFWDVTLIPAAGTGSALSQAIARDQCCKWVSQLSFLLGVPLSPLTAEGSSSPLGF